MGEISRHRILVGPLAQEILRFGLPLAIGMGFQTAFNLVDAYLIARLEHDVAGPALGAIGICDQLAAMGTIVSYGLSVATATILSRKVGQRDLAGVRRVAWQSLLVVLALSVIFGLFGTLGAEVLIHDIVGAKGRVAELSVSYLRVLMGGSFTIFLLLHLTTIQRALGSSKTPVSMMIAANVLNLFLAVLLVYGPGEAPTMFRWGPKIAAALGIPRLELVGAAWATLIARLIVLLPLIAILVKRFELFRSESRGRFERGTIAMIWRLGWPSSAQLVVRILAMLLTHSLVARAFTTEQDQTATTALGIVFRLETMALFVGLGWGSASQTFVGQNLGAANLERAKMSGYYAALYNAIMMAGLAAAYAVFGRDIIAFFDSDPEVLSSGLSYLRWVGASYIGLGIGIVLAASIQGAGATMQALILDALVLIGFQLPLSLFVVLSPDTTYENMCQVVALTYIAFAVVYAFSYRRGTFLRAAVT